MVTEKVGEFLLKEQPQFLEERIERKIGNRELPIWQKIPEILEILRNNNCLILISETGGEKKTTQVPQALWSEDFTKNGKIFIVENRRGVTTEVARRVVEEMKGKLGQEAGYFAGLEKNQVRTRKLFL